MVKILTNQPSSPSSRLTFWVGLAGMGIGVAVGFGAGVNPFYVGFALGALSAVVYFFTKFEQAVMGLLILRSSLDIFTTSLAPGVFKQIPAALDTWIAFIDESGKPTGYIMKPDAEGDVYKKVVESR